MKISSAKCKKKQVQELIDAGFWLIIILFAMITELVTEPLIRRQVPSLCFLGVFLVLLVCKVVLARFLGTRICLQHKREKQKLKERRFPGDFEPPAEWVGCPVPRPQTPPTLFASTKIKPEED